MLTQFKEKIQRNYVLKRTEVIPWKFIDDKTQHSQPY